MGIILLFETEKDAFAPQSKKEMGGNHSNYKRTTHKDQNDFISAQLSTTV